MGTKLVVTVNPSGEMTIASYCLKTDSWHDFLSFRDDARSAFGEGDLRNSNRYLRAAVIFLFAHLEGIVDEIGHSKKIFPAKVRGLKKKISIIEKYIVNNVNVPQLNIDFGKSLRDIVAHPGIEKTFNGDKRSDEVVFEALDLPEIDDLALKISAWLETICPIMDVPRFSNTEKTVSDFVTNIKNAGDGISDPIRSI